MKKILLLTFLLILTLNSITVASDKWSDFFIAKIHKENGVNYIPVASLKSAGINTIVTKDTVAIETPLTLYEMSVIINSVFELKCYDADGTYNQGSGFMLDGYLITNYHVAGKAEKIDIVINGQIVTKSAEDIAFKNESLDIVGIKLEGQDSLKSGNYPVTPSQEVYAIGFPKGVFSMSAGSVINTFDKYDMQMILSNVKTFYGSSGGALINDVGEVIGITSRINGEINESIPINYVIDEINKL